MTAVRGKNGRLVVVSNICCTFSRSAVFKMVGGNFDQSPDRLDDFSRGGSGISLGGVFWFASGSESSCGVDWSGDDRVRIPLVSGGESALAEASFGIEIADKESDSSLPFCLSIQLMFWLVPKA